MTNESKQYKVFKFKCKEPGCIFEVEYKEPTNQPGFGYAGYLVSGYKARGSSIRDEDTETIYLTCPKDHCYPYDIPKNIK